MAILKKSLISKSTPTSKPSSRSISTTAAVTPNTMVAASKVRVGRAVFNKKLAAPKGLTQSVGKANPASLAKSVF